MTVKNGNLIYSNSMKRSRTKVNKQYNLFRGAVRNLLDRTLFDKAST